LANSANWPLNCHRPRLQSSSIPASFNEVIPYTDGVDHPNHNCHADQNSSSLDQSARQALHYLFKGEPFLSQLFSEAISAIEASDLESSDDNMFGK